jgi:hypothetical protein
MILITHYRLSNGQQSVWIELNEWTNDIEKVRRRLQEQHQGHAVDLRYITA